MNRVDILPDGDIVLAVSGSLELRVSSVVLSMTSPVFKTMLGPHFAEGHALRRQNAGTPHIVTLPDDNAELMTALCLVSHHQTRAITVPTAGAQFIVQLTALADKYDCVDILRLPLASWAATIDVEEANGNTTIRCAAVALRLDDAHFFAKCTRVLVLDGLIGFPEYEWDAGGDDRMICGKYS
ncbi:hypothetical protein LTR17_008463 [Elasticomyces elasticus]|nr:hypothetical protein LTR17_008463 [Elasticomyces elasticus]